MRGLGVRVFFLLFDKEQDADVIERMERRPSTMTSYVRELVRRDMHDEQLRKTATMLASARTDLLAKNAKLREYVTWLEEAVIESGYVPSQTKTWLDAKRFELGIEVSA